MPSFEATEQAKRDLRRIELKHARMVLLELALHARTGAGDVIALKGIHAGKLRLRAGDFRVIFRRTGTDTFHVLSVDDRTDSR